jgi:hypothetical protein
MHGTGAAAGRCDVPSAERLPMFSFTSEKYGSALSHLLIGTRLNPLGPGEPDLGVRPELKALTLLAAFPSRKITDYDAANCCLAGLWLYYGFLDESHHISQDIHSAEGSFWHAIMHRREPDAANSKFWWRKVGNHPVLDGLRAQGLEVGYTYTDPFTFVDLCERVRDSGTPEEEIAKNVQLLEWRLLFDYCFDKATASA